MKTLEAPTLINLPDTESFNLSAVATEFEATDTYSSFTQKVREYETVGSAGFDIDSAIEALEHGVEMIHVKKEAEARGENGNASAEKVAAALFSHAVILYARAMRNRGNRARVPARVQIPDECKGMHDRLLEWRDKAAAHHDDTSERAGGYLIKEVAVMDISPSQRRCEFSVKSTRMNFVQDLVQDLSTMLDVAHDLLDKRKNELARDLEAQMIGLMPIVDPTFASKVTLHPFNPDTFFDRSS